MYCRGARWSRQSDNTLYYKRVEDLELQRSQNKILNILNEALEDNIISEEEFRAMDQEEKNAAKFYCNFKIHKPHTPMTPPPPRPIISGSGSITENLGVYVEKHINFISTQHQSYIKDTPHFLRIIHKINMGPKLPKNTMIATTDLTGAYQNIPQQDGLECLHEALEERTDKTVPSDFLTKLMELVQTCNIF